MGFLKNIWKGRRRSSNTKHSRHRSQFDDEELTFRIPPPPPREIMAKRDYYVSKIKSRKKWHMTPEQGDGTEDDTPLYALYRLYECFAADYHIGYRNEIEIFFHRHEWSVHDIPDPRDPDPLRYAFLACIPDLLVEAFNKNIKDCIPRDVPMMLTREQVDELLATPESGKQYEHAPAWTRNVPRLPHTLKWPTDKGQVLDSLEDKRASEAFKRMNILLWKPHIHFT